MPAKKSATVKPRIRERGDTFFFRMTRRDAAGKVHYIYKRFPFKPGDPKSRELARGRANKSWIDRWHELQTGSPAAEEEGEEPTLGELLERYKEEVTPAKNGAPQERSVITRTIEDFPDLVAKRLSKVLRSDLDEMRTKMKKSGYKDSAPNRRLMTIGTAWKHAATSWDNKVPNPVAGMPMKKDDDRRDRIISDKEWEAILGELRNNAQATRAAIEFLRWSGARRSEAVKLDWGDIRWRGAATTAWLRDTKSSKGRTEKREREVPTAFEGFQALQRLLDGKEPPKAGPVFSAGDGKPLRGDTLTQAWDRACTRLKIANARLHDLRHTRITEIAGRMTIQKVMAISGHRDMRMLARYYHPKGEDIADELASLEAPRYAAKKAAAKKSSKPGKKRAG